MNSTSGDKEPTFLIFSEPAVPALGQFGAPNLFHGIPDWQSPFLPGVIEEMGNQDKVVIDRASGLAGLKFVVSPLGNVGRLDAGNRRPGEPVVSPVGNSDDFLLGTLLSWCDGRRVLLQGVTETHPIRLSPVYELAPLDLGFDDRGPCDGIRSTCESSGPWRITFTANYRLKLATMPSDGRHCDQIVTRNNDQNNDDL